MEIYNLLHHPHLYEINSCILAAYQWYLEYRDRWLSDKTTDFIAKMPYYKFPTEPLSFEDFKSFDKNFPELLHIKVKWFDDGYKWMDVPKNYIIGFIQNPS